MEKFYKIKENLAEIVLPINVYPLVAVKKHFQIFYGKFIQNYILAKKI